MYDAESNSKVRKFVDRIMELMEAEHMSIAEAEEIPERLSKSVEENGKRIEKSKPFTVYHKTVSAIGTEEVKKNNVCSQKKFCKSGSLIKGKKR